MPHLSIAALQFLDPRGRCNRTGLLLAAAVLLGAQVALGFGLWSAGIDLTGAAGKPMFAVGGVISTASSANTGTASVTTRPIVGGSRSVSNAARLSAAKAATSPGLCKVEPLCGSPPATSTFYLHQTVS